jgi:hypothetical protein
MTSKPTIKLPTPATSIEGEIIALIGRLIVQWANCESWLIKLLAVLLKSDIYRAEIIFYAITTSVTRRALLHRLFMVYVGDEKLRAKFSNILDRFKSVTEMRNKFCHAQYQFRIPQYMASAKFGADFDGSQWIIKSNLDKNLLNELKQGIINCQNLAKEITAFVDEVSPAVLAKPIKPLHKHAECP